MKKVNLLLSAGVLLTCISNVLAQDWPQYQGPNRNSTSPQKGILRSWPGTGPEVLWTADLGVGFGGPVIKDGKAYLLDRDNEVGDYMRCFDMETGKELWKYGYEAPGTVEWPGSRSVPADHGSKNGWKGPELVSDSTFGRQASDQESKPVIVYQGCKIIL